MRLPWIAAAGILLLLVSGGLLDALSGHGSGLAFGAVWSVAALVSTGFGLVVATRRRGHPIGWLLLANGGVMAAMGFSGGCQWRDHRRDRGLRERPRRARLEERPQRHPRHDHPRRLKEPS